MDEYYYILELKPGASEQEIKKAYRRLARKYHPDVSKEPDAQERFLEIAGAYECLIEGRTPAIFTTEVDPKAAWEAARRERARRYAEMRYEQFKSSTAAFQKSWYFLPVKILTYGLIGILYVICVGICIGAFVVWYYAENAVIVLCGVLLLLLGPQFFQLGRVIYKSTKVYFDEFDA